MSIQTLRECPFCGHAVTVDRGWTVEDPITIRCAGCGLVLKSQWRYPDMSGTRVITGWNTRHADTEIATLKAENAELQEKLRQLEGIEECIMEQESKDFDQAMELQALRELREVVRGLRIMSMMGIGHDEPPHWVITKPGHDLGDLVRALAACDARAIR